MKIFTLMFLLPILCFGIMKPTEDFIIGVDLSTLYEIEKQGGKFYENGIQKDCLEILKDNGVNWIRLRIWNDPTDENGEPLGGGNCNYMNMTQIAQRAKMLGMKVLIDFHYSDWWADPGKQNKPKAWENLHDDALKKAVYEYTRDVLVYMKDHQALPDMVQIGNELNNGFLWPDGKISGKDAGGFDGLASLLKEAVRAVREVDPKIKVMIHLAEGGNSSLFKWFFDSIVERKVDFDVIGASYYPYWHGALQDLSSNLNYVSLRYGKDVVVAETAYAWTLEDEDGYPNIFGPDQISGYKPTVKGQTSFLRDLIRVIRSVPEDKGLGFFYWEGAWIPVKDVGWKSGEGNPWENQTLFDFHGNLLSSVQVFKDSSLPSEGEFEIEEVAPVRIEIFSKEEFKLPEYVKVTFKDDSIRSLKVKWNEISKELAAGEYVVEGTILELGKQVQAKISVKDKENYMLNPSFESGEFGPWQVNGEQKAIKVVRADPAQNAHHGIYAVNYWLDKPFEFELYQIVTDIPNGIYEVSMWIQGSGGDLVQLKVSDYGGQDKTITIANNGWLKWSNPKISNIQILTNRIRISVIVKANAGNWGWIDQFELVKR
ncbi:glycosyl hydrolase 53 family protein [Thermotoga profunda]|uniref:glycosyl hydrolase 53 family protein n=1 Tax=Thermotoga profunda TaxID=1508420 RepID=UPI000597B86C|nr:glycosyl hydrolase 53 family protein [Thermotoga profunda]